MTARLFPYILLKNGNYKQTCAHKKSHTDNQIHTHKHTYIHKQTQKHTHTGPLCSVIDVAAIKTMRQIGWALRERSQGLGGGGQDLKDVAGSREESGLALGVGGGRGWISPPRKVTKPKRQREAPGLKGRVRFQGSECLR